jgi:tryptophan halogenase
MCKIMSTSQTIRSVVIVGGGTAGWLTAAIVAAEHRGNSDQRKDTESLISVTLIESPEISTIGVGEGTWPSMRTTLKKIGISETELFRECDASFKQGTLFRRWRNGKDDIYTHPFTVPHGYENTNLAPHWQLFREKVDFAQAVSSQNSLMLAGLAPKQIVTPEYGFHVNYGYHLDAVKFAKLLQKHCVEKLGVIHHSAKVVQVNSDSDNYIVSLDTDVDTTVSGDLFVDASGSRSLLLGKHYGIAFHSKKQFLFNDTGLASQVPYVNEDDPIASSTLSTAQKNGWIWDIGLPSRRGIGHVYSSSHTTEERATEELLNYIADTISPQTAAKTSVRKVNFEPGHRAEFWHKNCVAVGMSAGFIEPLEASALVLVELSAAMISEQLPENRHVMKIIAKRFNQKFLYRWERIIDFLKLHYILTQRNDSDYWKDNQMTDSIPFSIAEALDLWKWQSPWHQDTMRADEMFPSASYQYILYGMNFETKQCTERSSSRNGSLASKRLFLENIKRTEMLVSSMPTNRILIDKIKAYGLQKI